MNIEKLTVETLVKAENTTVVLRENGNRLTVPNSRLGETVVAVGDILVVNADTLEGDESIGVIATVNTSDLKKSDVVVERAKPTLSGKNKGSNSNKATMSMRD